MAPEFSRPLSWALIRHRTNGEARHERLQATPEECAALARRFGILAVNSLTADISLKLGQGGTALAKGRFQAEVVQACIVSLKPIEQRVDEAVNLRFLPEGKEPGDDSDPDVPDEIPTQSGVIDLGEAVAETLSLSLDPYPRDPLAAIPAEFQAPEEEEAHETLAPEEAPKRPNPFAALAGLKKP